MKSVAEKLTEAQTKTEAGTYDDALAVVRTAKALEPRNVYILAFERQIEQLIELTRSHLVTDEQRTDILDSIPGIVEKAADAEASELVTRQVVENAQSRAASLEREQKEKAAALEWLKNQYFQHAHDYVNKGEYEHALTEIRRVYIIDPANVTAKEFEEQIEQLVLLKRQQKLQRHPALQDVAMQSAAGSATSPPSIAEPERKSRLLYYILIPAALLLLAAIAYFFLVSGR
jgi:tetratricopeptide (TPR) repeat protein